MLAAVRIVREQQQAAGRREHEQRADQRLLIIRPLAIGPGQQRAAEQRRDRGGDLDAVAVLVDADVLREDHAERGDLRDREIDEDDAAREHLLAERHVRRQHEQARDAGGPENAELESFASSFRHREQLVDRRIEQAEQILRLRHRRRP